MLIFIYILLLIFNLYSTNTFLVEDFKNYSGEYIVYTNSTYLNEIEDVVIVSNYNGQVYKTNIENFAKVLTNVSAISSETLELTNVEIDDVLNKVDAKIIEIVKVSNDITLYNCYSKKYKRYVVSNGNKINIQIAVTYQMLNVGYPVLIDY